jgi:hypothetical protein
MTFDPLGWESSGRPFDGYDIAQICNNGHPITSILSMSPGDAKNFCPTCGAKTITTCAKCEQPIRGSSTEVATFGYTVPKSCENCGEPYPWTAAKLQAADQLAGLLEELDEKEKRELRESIQELSSDTPKTPVAAAKIKQMLGRLSKDAYQVAVRVIADVATEAAKKQLGL